MGDMAKSKTSRQKSGKNSGRGNRKKSTASKAKKTVKTIGNSGSFLKSKRMLGIVAAVAILAIAGFFGSKFLLSPRPSIDMPPLPDFTGVEIQVATKIQGKHFQAEQNPASARAWGLLAMNLDIHGFKEPAVPCYKQAAELEPDEFKWTYLCAIALLDLNSPEAGEWFKQSQRIRPQYEPAYLRHAEALFNIGDMENSEKYYQEALKINPKSSHAYLGLGKMAYASGAYQQSLEYLQGAVKNDPRHGEVHRYLGEVYRRLEDLQKAEEEAMLAQQLPQEKPLNDPVYESLLNEGVSVAYYQDRGRTLMGKGLYPQAAQEFQTALDLRPDALQHNNMGIVLEKMGNFEEAIFHYEKAAVLDSMNWNTFQNLGTAYFRVGKDQEALTALNRALEINPTSVHAFGMLSFVYKRLDNTAEAIDALKKGLEQSPGDFGLAVRLAWLISTAEDAAFRDGEEAVRLTKTVCEETQYQFAGIVDVLAAAYAETGQFEKAAETAQQAYDLAISTNQRITAQQIQSRLKLYQSNKPYRE